MTPRQNSMPDLRLPPPAWDLGLRGASQGDALEAVVDEFAAITLEEMSGVALMDRFDTKYILRADVAAEVLSQVTGEYRALEVAEARLQPYRTVYFDTGCFALYRAHHSDRPNRYKVRSREYVTSGVSFVEVKRKDRQDRTVKERIPTSELVRELSAAEGGFIEATTPFAASSLEPTLLNSFRRLTLASTEREERATLDFGLTFHAGGRSITLPGLVVAEVKEAGRGRESALAEALRQRNIRPSGFSKYCIGVAMLYPGQKHNRFNPELRRVRRLHEESSHVCRIA